MCAKNYENWLAVDKIFAAVKKLTYGPPYSLVEQKPSNMARVVWRRSVVVSALAWSTKVIDTGPG